MKELYDHYFASRDYDQRYPHPNCGTLRFLYRHGIAQAQRVMDIGCGSGRYALPLLRETFAEVIGCDISAEALSLIERRARAEHVHHRLRLVHGLVADVPSDKPLDAILLLFGVLSHIEGRVARLALLEKLQACSRSSTRLFLSVPSIWRRRPLELWKSIGKLPRDAWGDIHFTRRIAGAPRTFFYHLYTLADLSRELEASGWRIERAEAESVLPEWLVTRVPWINTLDSTLQPWCPPAFGYGIRVLAAPVAASRA